MVDAISLVPAATIQTQLVAPLLRVLSGATKPPYPHISYERLYTTLYRCRCSGEGHGLAALKRVVDLARRQRDLELESALMAHYGVALALAWAYADAALRRALLTALQPHAVFRDMCVSFECKHRIVASVALGVGAPHRKAAIRYARSQLYVKENVPSKRGRCCTE